VLTLLAVVVVLDQAAKWWAWRHVPGTRINSGGDVLVGPTIGAWYASPAIGALLDLLDFGLLSIAVSVLARRRASAAVVVPGALMTGGWGSNLSDRLGIHYWTAPGSVRGVVDFIHIGEHYYNVADFFIIGCTPVFLLAAGYQGVRAARRPVAAGSVPPPARSRLRARARIPALAAAGLILVVALGAANYGGVNAARRAPARKTTCMHVRSRSTTLAASPAPHPKMSPHLAPPATRARQPEVATYNANMRQLAVTHSVCWPRSSRGRAVMRPRSVDGRGQ
jgi:lipoprotein signal peptidase